MQRGESPPKAKGRAFQKFDADLFDPNDLTVRLRGAYEAYPGIYAVGQSIFPHGRHGGGEYIGLGYAY